MKAGERVEDFEAVADDGTPVRLSHLLESGPVVLSFYPRAMTPGCTKQTCHLRDLAAEFAEVGAQRIGISADSVERQAEFSAKNALGFPLLSDPKRSIARSLGVKRPGPLMNKRMTFVIDTDRTVLEVISSEFDMDTHADRALATLRKRGS